ncbi:hypothetical protein MPSEU_000677600 [Mayamaea pseudoterrestris]|nr:hypothetical protein MPSEU_000677600 [Mayamaea pseudoterrestris]
MASTHRLRQEVCIRYGWSTYYDQDDDGYWYVQVTMGLDDDYEVQCQTFTSDSYTNNVKLGMAAASQCALDGLYYDIEYEESKPRLDLVQAFEDVELDIKDSDNSWVWQEFYRHKPRVVGIDVEGNNISPPVLVQIATEDYVILEAPQNGYFSRGLYRLLRDKSITKVFCDKSNRDKTSLKLSLNNRSVVELEDLANDIFGTNSVARGLGKIATLCMPDYSHLAIVKPKGNRYHDVREFVMIEQGRAEPLESIYDLSDDARRYAALDAWVTLECYMSLQKVEY